MACTLYFRAETMTMEASTRVPILGDMRLSVRASLDCRGDTHSARCPAACISIASTAPGLLLADDFAQQAVRTNGSPHDGLLGDGKADYSWA